MSDSDRSRGDLATKPLQPDKSLGELFGELTSDMGTLFRKEVELAKLEAKDELKQGGKAAGMFAGAGLGAWMAVLFLSLALAWLLDQAMNTALAFAIVGVVWAIVAAVLAQSGKKKMAAVKPLPQTTQTIKEDAEWARTQKS
jgi:F0F1-type ATP synthase assembly protein I